MMALTSPPPTCHCGGGSGRIVSGNAGCAAFTSCTCAGAAVRTISVSGFARSAAADSAEPSAEPLIASLPDGVTVAAEAPPPVLEAVAVRRRYRELSVAVHPDKCTHPDAEKARGCLPFEVEGLQGSWSSSSN